MESTQVNPQETGRPPWIQRQSRWAFAAAAVAVVGAGGIATVWLTGSEAREALATPALTVTVTSSPKPAVTRTVTVDLEPEAVASLDAIAAGLDARSLELDAREVAVTGQEDAIAAGTVPGEGIFLVGTDIQPGTYRSNSPTSGNCYYARLSSLSGGSVDSIIDNNNSSGPTVVEIGSSDVAFESSGCNDWTIVQ